MVKFAQLALLDFTVLAELLQLSKCALQDFTHRSVNHHVVNVLKVFHVQIQHNLQLHAQILLILLQVRVHVHHVLLDLFVHKAK